MIKLIDDTNVNTDQWGFTEFRFCNPPAGGYREWVYAIALPYDFIRGGNNSSYVGSIHITLSGECNFTLELFVIFYLAEKFGYEVVFHGHKNLLPLFSLISHRAIVFETGSDFEVDILSTQDINYFNEAGAQKKFPESFCSWRYQIEKYYYNDFAEKKQISLNRPDRLQTPYVKNHYYIWDGHLVGPPSMVYAELIEKCEYFPTVKELVEFYYDRDILVLKSVWDLCSTIQKENPYWENDKKFWVEYKDGFKGTPPNYNEICSRFEKKLIEVIGDNFVTNSLVSENKKMQYWIWENYSYAFLTYQLYCSLILKMQFCTAYGSSNFCAMIPQINVFSSWTEDPVFPKIMNFKSAINERLFGHKTFVGHWRQHWKFGHNVFLNEVMKNEFRITK